MRMIILTKRPEEMRFHLLKTEEVGFNGDTITITFRNICVPFLSFSLTRKCLSAQPIPSFLNKRGGRLIS